MSADGGPEIRIMVDMYNQLREEIIQAIQFQNQVILSEAVVIGVVYGLQFSGVLPELAKKEPAFEMLIAAIPPIIIISASLWMVEQTRMMRAGDYLQFLENRINSHLDEACLTWENWLRNGNTPKSHDVHTTSMYLGYLGFFYVLGALGLWLYVIRILDGQFILSDPKTIYFLLNVVGFLAISYLAVPVIAHSDSLSEARFIEWEHEYMGRVERLMTTAGEDESEQPS